MYYKNFNLLRYCSYTVNFKNEIYDSLLRDFHLAVSSRKSFRSLLIVGAYLRILVIWVYCIANILWLFQFIFQYSLQKDPKERPDLYELSVSFTTDCNIGNVAICLVSLYHYMLFDTIEKAVHSEVGGWSSRYCWMDM